MGNTELQMCSQSQGMPLFCLGWWYWTCRGAMVAQTGREGFIPQINPSSMSVT